MIDTTFHISDLLVVGGACCTAITFVGRAIVRAVKHRLYTIDMTMKDHGKRIMTLEEAKKEHEEVLRTLGYRPGYPGLVVRRDVEGL